MIAAPRFLRPVWLCLAAAALFTPKAMSAATFTVTNTAPSGPGSLQHALIEANATGGLDTVNFNIPPTDPGYDPETGVCTIRLTSALGIASPVLIDGFTQPGAQQSGSLPGDGLKLQLKIVLHFDYGGPDALGLYLVHGSDRSTIRGLVFKGLSGAGSSLLVLDSTLHNVISRNFFGTDAAGNEADGSGAPHTAAEIGIRTTFSAQFNQFTGNLFAGRTMTGFEGSNSTIRGNFFGTNPAGTAAQPLKQGLSLIARNTVGGGTPFDRNILVSDRGRFTISVPADSPGDNFIYGNYIGTDVTGTAALGANCGGVLIAAPRGSNVSGAPSAQSNGNVISGNALGGVRIAGGSGYIANNLIGLSADRKQPLPNGFGVEVHNGSAASGSELRSGIDGNVIAFNAGPGIVLGPGARSRIHGNSIYQNNGLGIDLGGDGPTPNDEGDADSGANNLQNYPEITSVVRRDGQVTVTGRHTGQFNPSPYIFVNIFADRAADPSGFGEARYFLGSILILRTDDQGNASFSDTFECPADAAVISATAMDRDGNASEFSPAVPIPGAPAALANISTRAPVLTDERVVIGGFIVAGAEPKRILVRAIGPALRERGIARPLEDPMLELYSGGTLIDANDNWQERQQREIEASGLAPTNAAEPTILRTLAPGHYTFIARGKDQTTGVALVEAYDVDRAADATLLNISTRAHVGSGEQVMIAGFIIQPETGRDVRAAVRGIGPSLASQGVTGALADPTLEVHDANGSAIANNDDWKERQQAELEQAGLAPAADREAALIASFPPGLYTAVLRGSGETTGVALVEIYKLD
jgi:hypothetical protein